MIRALAFLAVSMGIAFYIGCGGPERSGSSEARSDGLASELDAGIKKAILCHVPPGNRDNAHTIVVGEPSVPAHMAHGDTMGACGE
jgi:hypothetical protein